MFKTKEHIIITALVAVIVIGSVLFYIQLRMERSKTQAYVQENFSKSIPNVSVQVKIKEETSEGQYNDSLYYPIEKWGTLTSEEIKADIQGRVDKWVNTVKNPAVEQTNPNE